MKSVSIICFAALLSGCASAKMPNVDFLKMPEFQEDYENIKDYPKVSEAPLAPDDVRSDEEWDQAARSLMKVRDGYASPPEFGEMETDAEIESRIEKLKAQAEAYKLDDPQ